MDSLFVDTGMVSFYLLVEKMSMCVYVHYYKYCIEIDL